MTERSHDVGDEVRLWGVFRDASGAQAEPDIVTLTVRHPDGTSQEHESEAAEEEDIEQAATDTGESLSGATGVYKATLIPDRSGVWWYAYVGSGAIDDRQERWFDVRRIRVPAVSS